MVFSDENELALLAEARRGSAQALATLLQANYAVVYRYLVKLTMDTHAAEDAAQDAMERAIRSFGAFDPQRSKFSTWLITIARNRWLDEIRKKKRIQPLADTDLDTISAPDAFAELIENDDLLKALGSLSPNARTPVTMSYVLGYSYEEIAGHMKIPLGTVKSRISNAMKQLRKELAGYEARG
jgi:RNA polymerase sigma-70 factor, ECF subfamily